MFESIREFVNALLEGRKFKCGYYTYFFDDMDGFCKKRDDSTLFGDMIFEDYMTWCDSDLREIVEPKWYENIPANGVLCKVQPQTQWRSTRLAVITHYNEGDDFPFVDQDNLDCFYQAIPLTKEEALEFIYEGAVK